MPSVLYIFLLGWLSVSRPCLGFAVYFSTIRNWSSEKWTSNNQHIVSARHSIRIWCSIPSLSVSSLLYNVPFTAPDTFCFKLRVQAPDALRLFPPIFFRPPAGLAGDKRCSFFNPLPVSFRFCFYSIDLRSTSSYTYPSISFLGSPDYL